MSLLHSRRLRILLPLVIFLFGCFNSPPPPEIVAPPLAGVVVMGETAHLAPGSIASFLVQVRDPYAASEEMLLAGRRVEVSLEAGRDRDLLFTGETDAAGLVHVEFQTPDAGDEPQQTLVIRAAVAGDREELFTEEVYIGRVWNVLVSTDKPVYQPGQVIHVRTLALDTLNLHAADAQTVTLTVADPQGNKLLQRALATSQYGVASVDFTLDSQATSGDYQITAALGPNTATRSVEVKPYTLPRFEITFHPEQSFYLPGETATGVIEARYFFGKPVAGGQVVVRGSVTDVTRETVFEVTGATDADGVYRYAVPVPDFFVGQLDNKSAQIDLEIEVVDTANHLESVDETITVAEKPLLIDAVPESGLLRPGLANRVYLDVSTPDGAPAPATLTITGDALAPITTTTDLYGLAVITLTAPDQPFLPLQVVATDAAGREVTQPLLLGGATGASATVLMRPARSAYQIGETANIDIYVNGHATTVYLDIIKGRQTFGLVALPVVGGVAQAALPIDGSLLGTLELNAYVIGDDGAIVNDRRLLLVDPAPAEIDVTLDADRYRPGDTATLDIQVQRDSAPMPGVVGLAIVDESVFSVQEQAPGFARTYFLLERELQEPRYEIHDFVELEDDAYSPYDNLPSSIRYGARAQELALTGLFAHELAARQPAPAQPSPAAPSAAEALAASWGNRLYLLAPLMGLAFYDGSRKRRRLLIALTIFALGAFFWSACAPAAMPAAPASEAPPPASASMETTATRSQDAPRLRQYFPETLYWLPDLETDADGRAQVQVPIADSITTWRVSVLASDRNGNLGSAQTGLRVFQEFFVEPDLPRFLTVGDEIDAPITIYNYLDQPQSIALDVAPGDWYTLINEVPRSVEVGPQEVTVVYLPMRVLHHGTFDLQVTATGATRSDAVVRTVEVLPDGQQLFDTVGGKLAASQTFTAGVPATAIPGTGRLLVRVYPGVVSQVLEGLEGLLQTPYGCFEQTSSVTYPNVMVLDYLKATGQAAPRIQLQAEQLINLGYQRLLTFEVRGEPGGFSLFGDPPAQRMLTAYGLMEFGDMAGVAYVDPDLMARVAAWLANQQRADGSWDAEGMTIESGLEDIQSQLATTAYIAWGLADAGYEPLAVDRAVRFMARALREAPMSDAPVSPLASLVGDAATTAAQQDSMRPAGGFDDYTLALAANALIAAGEDATPLLDVLTAHATVADGLAVWGANDVTFLGGYGESAVIETTALVAQALLRAEQHPDLAAEAIAYLVANRDPNGAFYTTQATVQALKALVLAAERGGEEGAAEVTVEVTEPSGKVSIRTFDIAAGSADVVQQFAFENVSGDANQVQITVEGERTLHYQLVTSYYLPWREVLAAPETVAPMRVAVSYDRSELKVNETVQALATVELLAPGMAGTVLVDLGIPPGFAPVTADLDALAVEGAIDRYELTGRQIILYLTNVRSGETLSFAYRLQAKYPIRAQTPASQVFDYYAPDQGSIEPPQRITVTLGTPEE